MNDPPDPVNIISPKDGYELIEGDATNLLGYCSDPDLPKGKELIFIWYSSIDGVLGDGQELLGIQLSTGRHIITLEVYDETGSKSETGITVNVVSKTEDSSHKNMIYENTNKIWIIIGICFTGIIISILILYIFTKKDSIKNGIEKKVKDSQNLSTQTSKLKPKCSLEMQSHLMLTSNTKNIPLTAIKLEPFPNENLITNQNNLNQLKDIPYAKPINVTIPKEKS